MDQSEINWAVEKTKRGKMGVGERAGFAYQSLRRQKQKGTNGFVIKREDRV